MTEGSPMRLIILLAAPMAIGNLFQQLYNVVDSAMVGKLVGSDALAAVGASGNITFLFFALCNGIGSGGSIITSQYFGAGDDRNVKKCIANTAYIMIVFPILIGLLAFFTSRPILNLLDTPKEFIEDADIYVKAMSIGIIFVSLYNFGSSMLRALGDSKTPLYFLVVSCFLNIGLDAFFICVLDMGVPGAAIATLISELLSGLGCLIYAVKTNPYFRLSGEDLKFEKKIATRIVKLGIPLSLQFSLIAVSCMALQKVVNSFGDITAAAFTATSRVEQVIHQPYQTISAALSTFVGQNYGAHKYDRVIRGYRQSFIIMIIFSVVMFPVIQLFGNGIVRIFVDEPEVVEMGGRALKITSIFYLFLGTIYVVRGILNGLGDAFFAFLNGIVEVIGRFTVPVILTGIAAFGLWGIWWSVGIVWFLSGFTAWLRYLFYKKRKIKE